MGRRDVPPREHRKPSKNARKEAAISLVPDATPPPPAVEVIKRKRKERIEEE